MTGRKNIAYLITIAALLVSGCKSEKKLTTYNGIFNERPVTLYIAPLQDNSQRKEERYPQDVAFNAERNTAARHLMLSLPKPLTEKGYYVVPPMAAKQIAQQDTCTPRQLLETDLITYAQRYGVDAILVVTLHRWKEVEGEMILFMEYALRSCKSNTELMHSWVQAHTRIAYNYKGEIFPSPADRLLMVDYDIDASTALRCRLAAEVSAQTLRNLPISSAKRQFEQDRYQKANATYFRCEMTDNGEIEMERISMEAFEEACFVN